MSTIFEVISEYLPAFASGLRVTLTLAGLTWLLGITLGLALSIVAPFRRRSIGLAGRALIFLSTATPMLVVLFWVHFPLQAMLGIVVDPFYTALLVLATLNGLSVYNLVASAAANFPRHYEWAGQVSGLSPNEIFVFIRVPILARQIAPAVITLQAFMLQCTVFSSLISVEDLFRVAQRINAIVYKPIEIYSAMACFYILASTPLLLLAGALQRRYSRDESER